MLAQDIVIGELQKRCESKIGKNNATILIRSVTDDLKEWAYSMLEDIHNLEKYDLGTQIKK